MMYIIDKAQTDTITRERVEEEWRGFLKSQDGKPLVYKGRPLCTVFVKEMFVREGADYVRKPHICLNIRWKAFIDYLDDEAKKHLYNVMKDGDAIMGLYSKILSNAFYITNVPMPFEPVYNPRAGRALEDFRKLLKLTGDMHYMKTTIENLVNFEYGARGNLQRLVEVIKRAKDRRARLVYIMHLIMDLIHLYYLIDTVNFIAAYALLRNIIEMSIKACAYYEYGKLLEDVPLGPDLFMYAMYLYEYTLEEPRNLRKACSWSNWRNELRRSVKIISKWIHRKGVATLEDIVRELMRCEVRRLCV